MIITISTTFNTAISTPKDRLIDLVIFSLLVLPHPWALVSGAFVRSNIFFFKVVGKVTFLQNFLINVTFFCYEGLLLLNSLSSLLVSLTTIFSANTLVPFIVKLKKVVLQRSIIVPAFAWRLA